MKKIHFLLMSFAAIVSCGAPEPSAKPTVYSTEELKTMTEEYIQRAQEAGILVEVDELASVRFSNNLRSSRQYVLGECMFYKNQDGSRQVGGSSVRILSSAWTNMEYCDRRLVLFHELGHCLSHKDHNKSNGESLMSPFMSPNRRSMANCDIVERYFSGDESSLDSDESYDSDFSNRLAL